MNIEELYPNIRIPEELIPTLQYSEDMGFTRLSEQSLLTLIKHFNRVKGHWDKLDSFYCFDTNKEEHALINWKKIESNESESNA